MQFNKSLRLAGVFILLLVVITVFTGCGGTPISDQVKIESVINDCFLAMNNQEWDKARSFCVYNSNFYNFVSDMESMFIDNNLEYEEWTLEWFFNIIEITINGNHATVDGNLILIETLNGEVWEGGGEETHYLEKINNNWKLF